MASASFEKMAGDRKSYRIGNFHNATNLSSRSIHLAGLSVAGFLRIFPQCARSRHTVPQRGTPIIVYRQQFPFHGICNWNPIDRGWRTPRNSTYRTSSFPLAWTLWHEPECIALINWEESDDHHRRFLSHGADRFSDPCHRPCRAL